MDNVMFYFLFAPAIASIVGAAVVAHKGNDGWGWLLFVAVLSLPSSSAVKFVLKYSGAT